MNKKIFVVALACIAFMSSGAFAMSVDYQNGYNTYSNGFLSALFMGQPIDNSNAGVNIWFYNNDTNVVTLQTPDEKISDWWLWVALHNSGENTTDEIVSSPHDIRVFVQCNGVGGWFNITSDVNNTWSNGYALFRLTYDTEQSVPVADMAGGVYTSPTGRLLYIKRAVCNLAVDNSSYVVGDWVEMNFWAENPSTDTQCGRDEAVTYLQTATVTIVDINLQIWQIMFQIFSIVIIMLAIFGLPLLLFKLVRWLLDEVKGRRKLF